MFDVTKHVRTFTYFLSTLTMALVFVSFLMYPLDPSDMNNGGCIVKVSTNVWKHRSDYVRDIDGFPWSVGTFGDPARHDKFKAEYAENGNLRMSSVYEAGYALTLMAMIFSFVHFVDSLVTGFSDKNDDDETLLQDAFPVVYFIFNFVGTAARAAAIVLLLYFMGGGTCPYGVWKTTSETVAGESIFDIKFPDFEDDADDAYRYAVAAIGVEIFMIIVCALMTQTDFNDEEGNGMGYYVRMVVGVVSIVGFVSILAGAFMLMAHRPDYTELQRGCTNLYLDRNQEPGLGSGNSFPAGGVAFGKDNREHAYKYYDYEKDSHILEGFVPTLAISSLLLTLWIAAGAYDQNLWNEAWYSVSSGFFWLAFFVALYVTLMNWMVTSSTGCTPLWTASNNSKVSPQLVICGIGMILAINFYSRGYSSLRKGGTAKDMAQRMTMASGMSGVF